MRSSIFALLAAATMATAVFAVTSHIVADEPRGKIDYDRDVRPILSNKCYACHGPDEAQRKAGLRLDQQAPSRIELESGATAIVPGNLQKSALVARITSADPEERMPPQDFNKQLNPAEIETLRRWVAQGGEYKTHWSFVPPVRPALPEVKQPAWSRGAIDRFILAGLEAAGLKPSVEADKTTLIRRLTLDLTGLPPTPAEVDAFVADRSDAAYQQLVDRLFASPHYGERMALEWLDAARFADTHGYHIDSGRDMTQWREWVIDAFNRNLPFDTFTIEQLAGDLLPQPTLTQRIASGFNRNHMINFEGGAIPQEYHNAYIVDRVNTTGTVWLGLTLGCTQCHDHKFDPITQKEYYQFYAFFHNVPESGLDGRKGNAEPLVRAPTRDQQTTLDRLAAEIADVERQLSTDSPDMDSAERKWEQTAGVTKPVNWTLLEPTEVSSRENDATLVKQEDGSILAKGKNPPIETYTFVATVPLAEITGLRLETLADKSMPKHGPGRSANGNFVLSEVGMSLSSVDKPAENQKVALKTASADFSQQDYNVNAAIDGQHSTGWAIMPQVGKSHTAVFSTAEPVAASGRLLTIKFDFLSLYSQHQFGRFRVAITGDADPHDQRSLPARIVAALAVPAEKRSRELSRELRDYYRRQVSPQGKALVERLSSLGKQQHDVQQQMPSTMVMLEMPNPRDTFVLVRGQYDKQGEKVTAGVPASLPPLAKDSPANRLSLARWLVDPAQPLTARVIVNRYWQMYFGTGLVKTSEDFGSQGDLPSHPELLDWLATEFISSGWDIKHMQRLIVSSAAYRQASAVNPALIAKDPENRLLARGPRHRLPAEFIRDQALAASGLLDDRIGGHSVSPYQPPGLWEELASRADGANWTAQKYTQSHGNDLYRRTMYTFWKRTSPPPTLATFDAPDRETCTVRRARTNTPLQALVLMNDPTYVEASRKMAERLLKSDQTTTDGRIALAFRLTIARYPTAAEAGVLSRLYDQQLVAFRANAAAAEKLLAVGESPRDKTLDAAELAAWSIISSVLLNLDETVTKS